MNDQIAAVITTFLYILLVLVVIRSLLSWFPVSPRNQAVRMLHEITEPLLAPARRILPRTGIIDLSALVVILLLYLMINVVNQAANS